MNDVQIKYMAERFLRWRLPDDFHPDAGISFEPRYNVNNPYGWPEGKHEPVGTNLFTFTQAEAMVRHMVEGLPAEQPSEWAAESRRLMDTALSVAKPVLGGPEGESILGYTLPSGLWLMLQANVRNLLSALSVSPKPERPAIAENAAATHRHVKRGTEYVLIGFGKMQAERWGTNARLDTSDGGYGFVTVDPVDMREVAIYRSVDDGSLWVRPREDFEDGRFVALATPHPSNGTGPKGEP